PYVSVDTSVGRRRRDDDCAGPWSCHRGVVIFQNNEHVTSPETIVPMSVRTDRLAERKSHDFVHRPCTGKISVIRAWGLAGVVPDKGLRLRKYFGIYVIALTRRRIRLAPRHRRLGLNDLVQFSCDGGWNLVISLHRENCRVAE